ncbi:hypothetical protein H2200_003714 [Cladophialophora chaetospira]|uniref:Uncharacterized protein n=1 Tax=Cladophialophora chaetospira TaxID=386627 RepID=A0AA38XEX5_9EURO|nr:hypothetical protein H2200_003714 [Cladophialophora chaetospira]
MALIQDKSGDIKNPKCVFEAPWKFLDNIDAGDKASAILSLDPRIDLLARNITADESDDSDEDEDLTEPRKRSRGPWDLQILHMPNCPPKAACATIERQWDNHHDRYRDGSIYPSSPFTFSGQDIRALKDAMLSLVKNATISATILPEDRHSIFVYVFQAMAKLRRGTEPHLQGDIENLLLGNRLDELAPVDIYASLSDRSLASEDRLELNESQKDGIRSGRHAPAGLILAQGPPGSGKTHFIIQAVSPFLRDTAKRHRVLLTAASNVSVDSMASDLQKQLQKFRAGRPSDLWQYIIRLHSIKTEKSILFRGAKQARERNLEANNNKSHKAGASNPQQALLGAEAASIFEQCQPERRYEGVKDERVRCIELSAGEVALQVAGLRPGSALSEPEKFESFVTLFLRISNGDKFKPEQWSEFEAALEELLTYTINSASAICATVAGAADSFFSQHYADAELLVVDEAARIPEYQMWPLLVFFPRAAGKILVGDRKQLPPTIKDDDRPDKTKRLINPAEKQLKVSFMERMQSLGFKTTLFNLQYRSVSKIADIYSAVCYDSKLGHGRPEVLDDSETAKMVIDHNRHIYRLAEPVVFYTVEGAEQGRNRKGSRFCEQYVLLVLRILQDLFEARFATPEKSCSIAVLTPYKEEKRLLVASLAKMGKTYSQARSVELLTVDSVQGLEFDIVIADPCVVMSPGFLNENRLNVMFSRARFALYVVGDSKAWSRMSKDDSKPLRRFHAHFSRYEKKFDASKKLTSEFFDENWLDEYEREPSY